LGAFLYAEICGERKENDIVVAGEAARHHHITSFDSPVRAKNFRPNGEGAESGAMRLQKCKRWAEKLALKLQYTPPPGCVQKSLDKAAPPLVIARSGLCDEAIPYCGVEIAAPLRGSQ
jgi:hypothetical protein